MHPKTKARKIMEYHKWVARLTFANCYTDQQIADKVGYSVCYIKDIRRRSRTYLEHYAYLQDMADKAAVAHWLSSLLNRDLITPIHVLETIFGTEYHFPMRRKRSKTPRKPPVRHTKDTHPKSQTGDETV